jgi:hypothetical protein
MTSENPGSVKSPSEHPWLTTCALAHMRAEDAAALGRGRGRRPGLCPDWERPGCARISRKTIVDDGEKPQPAPHVNALAI